MWLKKKNLDNRLSFWFFTSVHSNLGSSESQIDLYQKFKDFKFFQVIQRRRDGSEDFYRNWSDYERGFGNPDNEFWMGMQVLWLIKIKFAQPES